MREKSFWVYGKRRKMGRIRRRKREKEDKKDNAYWIIEFSYKVMTPRLHNISRRSYLLIACFLLPCSLQNMGYTISS